MVALHVITMDRDDELMRLLLACKPYVDIMRVCVGNSSSQTKMICDKIGAEYYYRGWDDNFSAQDNVLLDQAKEGEWILVQDDDEMPSEPLLKHLNQLTINTECDMVRIPSLDIIDGAMMCSVSDYLKQNDEGEFDKRFRKEWLFRYYDGVYMEGTPHRGPHKINGDWVKMDTGFPYFHIKSSDAFITNDCIHAFINPEQQQYSDAEAGELYESCEGAGIKASQRILPFLKYGEPSDRFRDWMYEHANEDRPIASWFAARYFLYRPDELDRYNFTDILNSGALLRLLMAKRCYATSNIIAMQLHPVLKEMLLRFGINHFDDIGGRHGCEESRGELQAEKGIDVASNGDDLVVEIQEMPIELPDREYRDDQQDDPKYWNQDDVVNNDTAKPFNVEEEKKECKSLLGFCGKYSLAKDATVLELGCGGGRILAQWAGLNQYYQYVLRLEGVDHSDKAIALAQERLPGVEFIAFDAVGYLSSISDFDVIYTHTMLQHNSDYRQQELFRAVYNALSDKGLFYLINEMTFSQHGWPKHIVDKKMEPWFADERGSAGTAAWWIARIVDCGFELLEYNDSRYVFRKIGGQ